MKKIFAVLVFVVSFAAFSFAQESKVEATVAKAQEAGPVMEFEATTVDYGSIEQGADPYRVFKFKNTGEEPLVIKHAKGSCGCTVPTYPKEPILPGETGEIKVRYDTNRVGPFNKTVTLTTNAVDERMTLIIKGKVEKKAPEPSGLPAKEGTPFGGGN